MTNSNNNNNGDTVVPRMSEQQRATLPSRRRFSRQFKADAVRLVTGEGYSVTRACGAIGIAERTLRSWMKAEAPTPEPCGEGASLAELQAENRRLRKELARAEMEKTVLEKATAYFTRGRL